MFQDHLHHERAGLPNTETLLEAAMPASIWMPRVWEMLGRVFCIIWALSLLVFPVVKREYLAFLPVVCGVLLGLGILWLAIRPGLWRYLADMPPVRFWLLLVILAAALRTASLACFPSQPISDGIVYHALAARLAVGQGFGNSTSFPPGYSILLAPVYWLCGPDPLVGRLTELSLGVAVVPIFYVVSLKVLPLAAARLAAIVVAILPTFVLSCAGIGTSSILTILFLLTMYLGLLAQRSWLCAGLLGACLGFGALVKPVFLLVPFVLLLAWLVARTHRAVFRALLCGFVMMVVLAPWEVRVHALTGHWIPVSSTGGWSMYVGLNFDTGGLYTWKDPVPEERDELIRSQRLRAMAIENLRQHPERIPELFIKKLAYMWGTTSTIVSNYSMDQLPPLLEKFLKAIANVGWAALATLATYAAYKAPVLRYRSMLIPLLLLGYVFALHLVFEVQSRYHIPVVSVLVLLGVAGLAVRGKQQLVDVSPYGCISNDVRS